MNTYIDAQIKNITLMAKAFKQSCKMAATKDDGIIDHNEERILKKINSITDRFIRELERIE